jgi:hypothetical protein
MMIRAACLVAIAVVQTALAEAVNLRQATVVVSQRAGELERTAAQVLVEEVEKRTGLRLPVAETPTGAAPAITLTVEGGQRQEGFRLAASKSGVEIAGADARGVLYGVGALLRELDWAPGELRVDSSLRLETAPASRIRGHQIGYRSTANSWDAWTVAQFDQYFRELALAGANAIENIPFQDSRSNPLMKMTRREANRALPELCRRYGLDYWVWTPADIDLSDGAKRAALLQKFDELFTDSVTLTGVFLPGGDPGHNHPSLVLPLMEDIAALLARRHPAAKLWLSLQGFNAEREEYVYRYIEEKRPKWLGGLVAGPSSPPIARTRARLPKEYGLRLYPDLTHNKICQYQVPHWDQAYALTLGREAINPRPAEFARIHNHYAEASDGFISYSDGVHDDVNKAIWTALAWDRKQGVREILTGYARFHFSPPMAEEIADAILALERNWQGPLIANGAVEATLREWQRLEGKAPQLERNWRWQMCLLRANYDAYVRRRLIAETKLEAEANAILSAARPTAEAAMERAMAVLNRAVSAPAGAELRARIIELCEKLFHSIGLQTSVEKYHASGAERGAVLDFIDYPLNNRWWLEDEFQKVRALPAEEDKRRRLAELARWENPGEGSYYDDIGNLAKSPRAEGDADVEPEIFRAPEPTFWWWDNGKSRARLSWQVTMWPKRMVYEGLDAGAAYVVRTSGYGQCLLRIDGERVLPVVDGTQMGEFKEFVVPAKALLDRRLELTWDIPADESHLNWRQRSRLAEVWLLKR